MRKGFTKGKRPLDLTFSKGQGWALGPETMKKGRNARQSDWGDGPDETQS